MSAERAALDVYTALGGERGDAAPTPPYASAWEHLTDELTLLALRLEPHVRRRRSDGGAAGLLGELKGLVISEEEAGEIVDALARATGDEAEVTPTAALESATRRVRARVAATEAAGLHLPLRQLARLFRLSPLEEHCLLVCLAPEVDGRFERLYAFAHDDVTRKRPSVGLVLQLLCPRREERLAARAAFRPDAALVRHRLVRFVRDGDEPPDAVPLRARALKLDDRIVELALDPRRGDHRIATRACLVFPEPDQGLADDPLRSRMVTFARSTWATAQGDSTVVFCLWGRAGAGKRALVEAVSAELGSPLLVVDAARIAADGHPFEDSVALLGREALLQQAALCVERVEDLAPEPAEARRRARELLDALRTYCRVAFVIGRERWVPPELPDDVRFVSLELGTPTPRIARSLWAASLAREPEVFAGLRADALAAEYRAGAGRVRTVLRAAREAARWRSQGARVTAADVSAAYRQSAAPSLGSLVRRVEPVQAWEDIALPAEQVTQLRSICDHARLRVRVLEEWGFERKLPLGKGIAALFHGPPGTGKTMAAQVIATELQRDLYQIDLSQVVSKYIGETEKNLQQVFDEADATNAILFFDEADALFGKRSEIQDAHDRYANVEVAYLLQRMEQYDGVAILATNFRQNLDDAFVRRLRFVVEFPFPDDAHRRRIWEITFPREAPLAADVDFAGLARELKLAGGSIKNIALSAAFAAAARDGEITAADIRQAARREQQKLGRAWDGGAA